MIKLTVFKTIYDNKTHREMKFEDFSGLEDLLYSLSTKPGYKPPKGERTKKASPLISPAIYKTGIDPDTGEPYARSNRNVLEWVGWCALDVDDYTSTFKEFIESIPDFYYVCYSTASSTKEHPKFRLVFPLKQSIPREDIKHFWFALNIEMLGEGDESTKDLSRMFYVPAQYPDAHNFIFTKKGPIMDHKEIMKLHEYVPTSHDFLENLPPQLRQEILNQRKATLTETFSWTSYRDCPFVKDEMVMEYAALNDGRYRFIYHMMCSIAAIAVKRGYAITAEELGRLVREIDNRYQSGRFKKRKIIKEANRALEFVYGSM